MGSYRKQVKGDNNTASEVGSFNRIFIDLNGWPIGMFVLFVIVLISAAIIWMITQRGGLLTFLIQAAFICFFAGAGIVGACFVARYISGTRRQLNSDKAAEAWEKLLHYTDSHIVLLDPKTQTFRIENARDIQEVRHFNDKPVITEMAESLNTSNDMPPTSDLLR
jgi:hypothetical protein